MTTRSRLVGVVQGLAFLGTLVLRPAPFSEAEAKTALEGREQALVNLDAVWAAASGGAALDERYVEDYLRKPYLPQLTDAGAPAGEYEGEATVVVKPIDGTQVLLPIVSVSVQDSRDLQRRKAALARYLQTFRSWFASWSSADPSLAGRTGAEEVRLHSQRASAANLELFVLESIDFQRADTQALKCSARLRASDRARALGLSGERALFTNADFPAEWAALWTSAQDYYQQRHATFDQALCSSGRPVTQAEIRQRLEGALDRALSKTIADYFGSTQRSLGEIQKDFAARFQSHVTAVPTAEIQALIKRVEEARIAYDHVAKDESHVDTAVTGLAKDIETLSKIDRGQATPAQELDDEFSALIAKNGEVSAVLALAHSLADIPYTDPDARAALAPCAAVPSVFGPGVNNSQALPGVVDACVRGALALRERLLKPSAGHPEREAFMHQLASLSDAYLAENTFE